MFASLLSALQLQPLAWLLSAPARRGLVLGSCLLPATSPLARTTPFLITHGGTYTGTFRSTSSDVPCVRILTTEPVVLEQCVLYGPGNLIEAEQGRARLTITHCQAFGLLPTEDGRPPGRFLSANQPTALRVEHNYLEQTAGMYIYQWSGSGAADQTLTVRYNEARNIDGRKRGGGEILVQFLQLNTVIGLPNVEIAWNQVVNEPNRSRVEDNISLFNSSGTPTSPIRVHDNYVQGAYPFPALAKGFSGTGMTTDGDGSTPTTTTAYVEAYDNQFVSTCNAAMNIAAGHHIRYHHNRLVTSGQLPNGTQLNATYAAASIFNSYKKPDSVFFAHRIEANVIGYAKTGYRVPLADRHDLSTGACAACPGNVSLPNPITLATEQGEWAYWQRKLQQKKISLATTPLAAQAP
ncbi:hypothetical protein [Hymenobacter sp. CRA2]|uniref:hypothetical protein n=1 Tax=Hymenobacter sp. CRA2 TaxID=1955620 RepID=UPI00098F8F57|nr:hypothetical protein [Hymenobacter sp. CRA2]OON65691.1 hypothetical protein B0919_23745 [Hymenobacter sp. CRA2]